MKRLIGWLLLAVLVVSCGAPAAEESPAETLTESPALTPVTPGHDHDHEHIGEILPTEVYRAIIDAANELPINVKYVDQSSAIAYGTELIGEEIVISSLDGDEKTELYRVDKATD
ncbi:MAG TPA: hypothetical protein GXZ74_01020 [Tissierellia bacterium]|nr:hypothetical protein [Tissierellia bacterium]